MNLYYQAPQEDIWSATLPAGKTNEQYSCTRHRFAVSWLLLIPKLFGTSIWNQHWTTSAASYTVCTAAGSHRAGSQLTDPF